MRREVAGYAEELVGLLKHLDVQKVILFGSGARDEMNEDSDLDLVVILDDDGIPTTYDQKLDMRTKVKSALRSMNERIAIDVIVHTKAEFELLLKERGSFLTELTETGKLIYEKTGEGVA